MSKNTVFIVSGGVNYYLSGGGAGQTVYAGSGTPWTAESTTPYELAYASGPSYTPQVAPGMLALSGGSWGAEVVGVRYDAVTEQIGVQMRGTTKDNAITLLRQLRQVVTTGRRSDPPLLAVTSGTNTAYFEVLWADVQETTDYLVMTSADATNPTVLFATITLTRAPHGLPASLTTLISAVTFTNGSTVQTLGTVTGDLLHEGQPMSLKLTGGQLTDSIAGQRSIYAASVIAANVSAGALGLSLVTSSTTPSNAVLASAGSFTVTPQRADGTHYRFLARITGPDADLEVRYVAMVGLSPDVFYAWARGPWVRANGTQDQVFDLGAFRLSPAMHGYMANATAQLIGFDLEYRSGTGGATTGTLERAYILQAYDFASLLTPSALSASLAPSTSYAFIMNSVAVRAGAARVLRPPVSGIVHNTTGEIVIPLTARGMVPRAVSGASLWLCWQRMNAAHTVANTITVTATSAPLARTLRGST